MLGRIELILVLALQQTLMRPCGAIQRSESGAAGMSCGIALDDAGSLEASSCAGMACAPSLPTDSGTCCCSCAPADEPITPAAPVTLPRGDDAGSMLPLAFVAAIVPHDMVAGVFANVRLPLSIGGESNNLRRARLCVWQN
jgi:hypothetical protein